jgi:hypothetical protein
MEEDTIGAACITHEYTSVAGKPEEAACKTKLWTAKYKWLLHKDGFRACTAFTPLATGSMPVLGNTYTSAC